MRQNPVSTRLSIFGISEGGVQGSAAGPAPQQKSQYRESIRVRQLRCGTPSQGFGASAFGSVACEIKHSQTSRLRLSLAVKCQYAAKHAIVNQSPIWQQVIKDASDPNVADRPALFRSEMARNRSNSSMLEYSPKTSSVSAAHILSPRTIRARESQTWPNRLPADRSVSEILGLSNCVTGHSLRPPSGDLCPICCTIVCNLAKSLFRIASAALFRDRRVRHERSPMIVQTRTTLKTSVPPATRT